MLSGFMSVDVEKLKREVAARRTFAIISHPDAGQDHAHREAAALRRRHPPRRLGQAAAGAQRARDQRLDGDRAAARHLDLVQRAAVRVPRAPDQPARHAGPPRLQRGHLPHAGRRRLRVMLIDSAKGVEPQTIKLFQVCRMRGIPIFTFINKLDRDGREPLDLLDEIERVLGIPLQPGQLADRLGPELPRRLRPLARSARCTSSAPSGGARRGADDRGRDSTTPRSPRRSAPTRHRQLTRRARAARRRRRRVRPRALPARAS